MALQSMTGFARCEGESGGYRWLWELRSVNGKGLDLRFRLPFGYEALEAECRTLASAVLSRGNVQISLSVNSVREEKVDAVVNEEALGALLSLKERLGDKVDPAPVSFSALLGIRGIIDMREPPEEPESIAARHAGIMGGFRIAVAQIGQMRESEGKALFKVLNGQLDQIEALALRVESDPSRSSEEIVKRLEVQMSQLMTAAQNMDRDRLYMEAALLATKADLREEVDRLKAHVAAARELLASNGPVGRKLDFLAQEFNRESNTICSKSNATAVTAAGLELKVVIDQFREQVQNLE